MNWLMERMKKWTPVLEAAVYREEMLPAGGRGAFSINLSAIGDVMIRRENENGTLFGFSHYDAFNLGGKGGVRPKPIIKDDKPERVLLVNDFPTADGDSSIDMRVRQNGKEYHFVVRSEPQAYLALKTQYEDRVFAEEAGKYFAVQEGEGLRYFINSYEEARTPTVLTAHQEAFETYRLTFFRYQTY